MTFGILYISLALTAALLVAFILVYRHNKMRLAPGLLFDFLLYSLILDYCLATLFVFKDNVVFVTGTVVLVVVSVLLVVFGLYVLLLFFLFNARAVYRRESYALANSLTLIAAGAIVVFFLVNILLTNTDPPDWLVVIWRILLFAISCFVLYGFVYLTSLILCNMARPKPAQDYIIVLGSGLTNGKVTPLLAQRVKRAMDFGESQLKKTGHQAVLIMSGGQGDDEPRSEAAAMAEYAVEAGWPQEYIVLEDRSRNTLENLRFSKQIMDQRAGGGTREGIGDGLGAGLKTSGGGSSSSSNSSNTSAGSTQTNYSCTFATSAYHLLRAGMFARQVGLKIDGLGAKSAWYFIPNATLREYIAYLAMHKRRVIVVFGLLLALGLLANIGYFLLTSYFVI